MPSRVNRLTLYAAGFALALVAILFAAYFVGPIERADSSALNSLEGLSIQHARIKALSDGFGHTVDLPYLLVMLTGIAAAGFAWGRRREAIAALALVAGANLLTQVIKVLAAHPRGEPILLHQLSSQAFPSGHTTAAASLALAAVLVVPVRWRPLTAAVAGGFALAVSISLVVAGWHYPSDVLGAYMVVGLVTTLTLATLAATEERSAATDRAAAARLRQAGALALRLGVLALGAASAALLVTHPGSVVSYAEAHTTAVAASLSIGAVWLALVSGVAAELEPR